MGEDRASRGDFGPPPDVEVMAELIQERYPLRAGEKLAISAREDPTPGLELALDAGKDRYTITIDYLRDAGEREVWMLLADALDALFGQFLESGRAYRELPSGSDVEWEGATFRVDVERTVPELSKRADLLLEGD